MKKANILKRIFTLGMAAALSLTVFSGCANKTTATSDKAASTSKEKKELKLAASPGPYGDMFDEAIAPYLEKKYGYKVNIIEYADGTAAHQAMLNGEIDVAIIGHLFYEGFLEENMKKVFTPIYVVPTAGAGIYSKQYTSLKELKNGDQVAVPSEASNYPRVLSILQAAGLIKVDPKVDPGKLTKDDIIENPLNLKLVEVDRYQTPKALDSVALSVIYGNVAMSSGMDLSKALYTEKLVEEYKNCLVVPVDKASAQYVKDIQEAASSKEFWDILNSDKYKIFQKPAKSIPDKFYTDQKLEVPKK